jgi:hypothetical protein
MVQCTIDVNTYCALHHEIGWSCLIEQVHSEDSCFRYVDLGDVNAMKKIKCSEECTVFALRQVESGMPLFTSDWAKST